MPAGYGLPPSDVQVAAKRDPQRVLRRVHSGPRGDRVRVRPVELVEGDAVERDADVVCRLLELARGLVQVDAVPVVLTRLCHRHSFTVGGHDTASMPAIYPAPNYALRRVLAALPIGAVPRAGTCVPSTIMASENRPTLMA